eukprot:gene66043-90369_t
MRLHLALSGRVRMAAGGRNADARPCAPAARPQRQFHDRAPGRKRRRREGFVMADNNASPWADPVTERGPGQGTEWWRGCVIYQVYPRSYQDTTGDGSGDLQGITRRLSHVASLGVDAIWLSPFFKSPMADMGYDVSDYRDVDPMFGTLEDFRRVVAKAHGLGMKVILDWVANHTAWDHPWVQTHKERYKLNDKGDVFSVTFNAGTPQV